MTFVFMKLDPVHCSRNGAIEMMTLSQKLYILEETIHLSVLSSILLD